jgi:hypothetical protein
MCTDIRNNDCTLLFMFKHSGLFLSGWYPQTNNYPLFQKDYSLNNGIITFNVITAA